MVHCSWRILLKGHDSTALRHEAPWRLCRGGRHLSLKLLLSNCCITIQVLHKNVGDALQFIISPQDGAERGATLFIWEIHLACRAGYPELRTRWTTRGEAG